MWAGGCLTGFFGNWSQLALDTVATLKETPIIAINYTAGRHPAFLVVGWDHETEAGWWRSIFLRRGHRRLRAHRHAAVVEPHERTARERLRRRMPRGGPSAAARARGAPGDAHAPVCRRQARDRREADAIFLPVSRSSRSRPRTSSEDAGLKIPGDVSLIGGENPGGRRCSIRR